jgi:hypothetical protein
MKLFVINTVSVFRHKYVVKAKSLEHAMDEVVMRDSGHPDDYFEEFSQLHVGENIIDGEEISIEKFNSMLEQVENDKKELSSYWLKENLIREVKYKE